MNETVSKLPFFPHVLVLYGPTGAGKTALSLLLAKKINIEIINMDMGQLYAPCTIGTAKPDLKEAVVEHHLFDLVDRPVNYSAAQYVDQAKIKIKEILGRQKIPVLVGGTGFYLNALLFELPSFAGEKKEVSKENVVYSWSLLNDVDPLRASKIHHNDTYRIKRALDIFFEYGVQASSLTETFCPPENMHIIHVTRERDELAQIIKQRTDAMFANEWCAEVRSLVAKGWGGFLVSKKLIGYDDIVLALDNDQSEACQDALKERIVKKTVAYVKRQDTFWRMLNSKLKNELSPLKSRVTWESCNLTFTDLDLYLNQLILFISKT